MSGKDAQIDLRPQLCTNAMFSDSTAGSSKPQGSGYHKELVAESEFVQMNRSLSVIFQSRQLSPWSRQYTVADTLRGLGQVLLLPPDNSWRCHSGCNLPLLTVTVTCYLVTVIVTCPLVTDCNVLSSDSDCDVSPSDCDCNVSPRPVCPMPGT